jgi:hypothetical protein
MDKKSKNRNLQACLRINKAEELELKLKAEKQNKSVSKYIRDIILPSDSKIERLLVTRNDKEIEKEVALLEETLEALNNALKSIKRITNTEVRHLDISRLNKWITNKTGFPSLEASVNLLDIRKEYDEIIEAADMSEANKDKISFYRGKYSINEATIKEIVEKHSQYLDGERLVAYHTLKRIEELYNSLDIIYTRSCIKIHHEKMQIDKFQVLIVDKNLF